MCVYGYLCAYSYVYTRVAYFLGGVHTCTKSGGCEAKSFGWGDTLVYKS